MTNIVQFKPKAQPKPEPVVAPDRLYWLEDLHMASSCAGLVHNDQEALDMIMKAQHQMLSEGRALTQLSLDLRTRCAAYFGGSAEDKEQRIKSVLSAIYSRP